MPLREISLEEMRAKLAEVEVSYSREATEADTQHRRERDNVIKDKVMASIGFVSDRHEGDAY